jgi:hypothetical protein
VNSARKVLWSVLIVAALGGMAAFGAFSAFSDTTSNPNNSFAAGTVTVGNNATSPLYSVSNGKPGAASTNRCIKITYSGSLPATVKVYRSALSGTLGQYLDLTVTKGTGSQEDCSDFVAGASVYSSTLESFGTDWTGGLALTNASNSAAWSNGDAVTYRFSAVIQDNNAAKGLNTGTHSFTWEARNN